LLAALACCSVLSACGKGVDVKESLGLNHEAPDEFRVLARPPLSVPPEFNLRPPGQESEYVGAVPAQTKAHDQVLGTAEAAASPRSGSSATAVVPVTSGALPGRADSQLLANAGSTRADPHIRQKLLDDKLNGVASKDPGYLFGGKKTDEPEVDATKESDRIKKNKAQNLPPTAGGATPVIAPKDKGILGDIF
jgi:hypothetical protein